MLWYNHLDLLIGTASNVSIVVHGSLVAFLEENLINALIC